MECVRGVSREVVCFDYAHISALRAHVWVHLYFVCTVVRLCLKLMSRGVTAMTAYLCVAPREYVLISAAA